MLTNKEYVESEGAKCPNCGIKSNQVEVKPDDMSLVDLDRYGPTAHGEFRGKIECLACGAAWWEVHTLARYEDLELANEENDPPDPKPVVVIEVEGGVASILECPEWVETVIVDKDTQPAWTDISRYHLAEMTDLGLTDLKIEVNRERGNIGETITLQLLDLISEERERRTKDD